MAWGCVRGSWEAEFVNHRVDSCLSFPAATSYCTWAMGSTVQRWTSLLLPTGCPSGESSVVLARVYFSSCNSSVCLSIVSSFSGLLECCSSSGESSGIILNLAAGSHSGCVATGTRTGGKVLLGWNSCPRKRTHYIHYRPFDSTMRELHAGILYQTTMLTITPPTTLLFVLRTTTTSEMADCIWEQKRHGRIKGICSSKTVFS